MYQKYQFQSVDAKILAAAQFDAEVTIVIVNLVINTLNKETVPSCGGINIAE